MSGVTFNIEKNKDFYLRWFLDTIKFDTDKLQQGETIIEGWIIGDENHATDSIIIEKNNQTLEFPFNVSRPDVVNKFYPTDNETDGYRPHLKCGFRVSIDFSQETFKLGVRINHKKYWAANIKPKKPDTLIGATGWIFLDNDTNESVPQFLGEKKVSENWIRDWNNYFISTSEYLNGFCKFTFLLAPSKEEVLQEEYPYIRTKETLAEKLILNFGDHITWPTAKLKDQKYLCYDMAETHWTDHGANIALSNCLADMEEPRLSDINATYDVVSIRGDLGDKVTPAVRSVRLKTVMSNSAALTSDNKIVNHGNIKIFKNSAPSSNKKLLIFGGSSANFMLPHAANLFGEVMFVHSTGSVDKSIVEKLSPDFVILQTNQRFIATPPKPFIDNEIFIKKVKTPI